MKVLFLWNTAGAMSAVIEWLNNNGHEARVLVSKIHDPMSHSIRLKKSIPVSSPMEFYIKGIIQILRFKPDVIHVSSSLKILIIARFFAFHTPIVFFYHGRDIRGRQSPHRETKLADKVCVTTPDLAKYGEWWDRPTPGMFYYRGGRKANTALLVFAPYFKSDSREIAKTWCKKRDIELTILDRSEEVVPHEDMPKLLSQFEYVLDFKGHRTNKKLLSKIALESLACGCKVVSESDLELIIMPGEYKRRTPEEYLEMYKSLRRTDKTSLITRFSILLTSFVRMLFGRVGI
jgi:hypothetical protein